VKKLKEEREIIDIETKLNDPASYPNDDYKMRVNRLEQRKINILADKEATQRLKGKVL
jgi:hypothetical protein